MGIKREGVKMKILDGQAIKVLDKLDSKEILSKLEFAGKICYKSETGNEEKFLKSIIRMGHESVIEHANITVLITTDRATANQIVRHRIASYSQESQRYCNYSKDKFGDEITVIKPPKFEPGTEVYEVWKQGCETSELVYFKLLSLGVKPEEAREVLPNSTKTELVMTMNIRSWRNFFKLRTHRTAGPNIRILSKMILKEFKDNIDILFDDFEEGEI